MIAASWKDGRARPFKNITDEDKCEYCSGAGETATRHRFGKGWEHKQCFKCHGTGVKKEVKEKYDLEKNLN